MILMPMPKGQFMFIPTGSGGDVPMWLAGILGILAGVLLIVAGFIVVDLWRDR